MEKASALQTLSKQQGGFEMPITYQTIKGNPKEAASIKHRIGKNYKGETVCVTTWECFTQFTPGAIQAYKLKRKW
jgi:hypothetical protein